MGSLGVRAAWERVREHRAPLTTASIPTQEPATVTCARALAWWPLWALLLPFGAPGSGALVGLVVAWMVARAARGAGRRVPPSALVGMALAGLVLDGAVWSAAALHPRSTAIYGITETALVGLGLYALGIWWLDDSEEAPRRRRLDVVAALVVVGVGLAGGSWPRVAPVFLAVTVGPLLALRVAPRAIALPDERPHAALAVFGLLGALVFAFTTWPTEVALLATRDLRIEDLPGPVPVVACASIAAALLASASLAVRAVRVGRLPGGLVPRGEGGEFLLRIPGSESLRVVGFRGPAELAGTEVTLLGARAEDPGGSPYRRPLPVLRASSLWPGSPAEARRVLFVRALGWLAWACGSVALTGEIWIRLAILAGAAR